MELHFRRLFLIIICPIFIVICLGGTIIWLNSNCSDLLSGNCQLLLGTTVISTLVGIFLLEMLINQQKKHNKKIDRDTKQSDESILSSSYVWFRPIAWMVLSTLLAGLPFIAQGAFVVTVIGIIMGILLGLFIRAITNRLPLVR